MRLRQELQLMRKQFNGASKNEKARLAELRGSLRRKTPHSPARQKRRTKGRAKKRGSKPFWVYQTTSAEKEHSSLASFLSSCLKALGWRPISLVPRPGAKGGCWVHLQHHGTEQAPSTIKTPDYILYSEKTSQFPTKSSSGHPGNSAWLADEGEPGATTQIQDITETSLRPDIVLFSGKSKTVVMLELTVPWEESTAHDPWSREQGVCRKINMQGLQLPGHHAKEMPSSKLQKWQKVEGLQMAVNQKGDWSWKIQNPLWLQVLSLMMCPSVSRDVWSN